MIIKPVRRLEGTLRLMGDKSVSHRAAIAASIAEGRSVIRNFSSSEDCSYTLKAFEQLGVEIRSSKGAVEISGKGLAGLRPPKKEIHLGESGTSMRLLAGLLAGQRFSSILTADESLSRRPMGRVIEPLRMMGADIRGRDDDFAPLKINGQKLRGINYKMKVASAQVKSAIMLAGLYADGATQIEEPLKSRDHTERMLSLFGAKMIIDGLKISIYGWPKLKGRSLDIPGDISSAAFFIVGALIIPGSHVIIKDVLLNRTRSGIIDILKEMGADIAIKNKRFNGYEDLSDIEARSGCLRGVVVEKERIPSVIDELPVLLVAAAFADGQTRVRGASELRVKETDRIASMTTSLKNMGVVISAYGGDICVEGGAGLTGARLEGWGDHRTVMSLAVAALGSRGDSEITGAECVRKSFPDFFDRLGSVSVR